MSCWQPPSVCWSRSSRPLLARDGPLLFDDDDRAAGEKLRRSIVAPAKRSPQAERKAARKRTDDGLPVHSFPTLLADLGTIVSNTCRPHIADAPSFEKVTLPNPLQQRALDLLAVSLRL